MAERWRRVKRAENGEGMAYGLRGLSYMCSYIV